MSQTLFVFLSLFCMFGWVSAGQCAFSDDLSLLQEHARALPQQKKWPDIGEIVDSVKEAADSAKDAANNLNDTIQDKLDQAASATSAAIQTIVTTLKGGLETILQNADTFENSVQKSVDAFLQGVQTNPDLLHFETAANQTLDAFGAALGPIASALDVSIGTVQDVLNASGFHKLSEDVGAALTKAMGAIKEANATKTRLKQKVGELATKVNRSAGNLSSEIDEDLTYMTKRLHNLVEEINKTFVDKTLEGYKTLASGLREKVEGVLPEKQLQEVVDSLDTIDPVVEDITDHVADPIQNMAIGFDESITEIREHVPASARGAAGFSLIAIVASMCTSFIML